MDTTVFFPYRRWSDSIWSAQPFDTGFAGYLSVLHSMAQESGLLQEDTPRIPVAIHGLRRAVRCDKIRATGIRVGGIDLSGCIIQVETPYTEKTRSFGLIGNRFLQNFRVTLDYVGGKLWLERVISKEEPDEVESLLDGKRKR